MDYQFFGDVFAFGATYKKNKHRLSIVIFFGVNNHKQTIVFKTPTVVITNGDMTMRNAIRRVFPSSRHRLCAWHLMQNASSNVRVKEFHHWKIQTTKLHLH